MMNVLRMLMNHSQRFTREIIFDDLISTISPIDVSMWGDAHSTKMSTGDVAFGATTLPDITEMTKRLHGYINNEDIL